MIEGLGKLSRLSLASMMGLSALSGCSGGGTSVTTSTYLDQYYNLTSAYYNGYGATGFTPVLQLPASASYSGISSLAKTSSPGDVYLGKTNLSVTFGGGSVSGSIGDFHVIRSGTLTETSVSGRFDIAAGASTGTNSTLYPAILATATGTLDGTYDSLSIEGNFVGTTGQTGQLLISGSQIVGNGYVQVK